MAKASGKPSILTPEIIAGICVAIKAGNYLDWSAAYRGIPKRTFYHWVSKGRKLVDADEPDPPDKYYRQFVEALDQAMAEAMARHVAIIWKAGKTRWQASAWWLERRHPDLWGQRQRREGPDSGDARDAELKDHEAWLRDQRDKL